MKQFKNKLLILIFSLGFIFPSVNAQGYLPDIQNYVDSVYSDSLGYNAAKRTQISNFMNARITPLVDPDRIVKDYTEDIRYTLYNISPFYGYSTGDFRTSIERTCYDVINLIVLDSLQPFDPNNGALILYGLFSQAGVAAPAFTFGPSVNTMGELPTFAYNSPGNYDLDFATTTPFTTPSKVEVWIGRHASDVNIDWAIGGANKLVIFSELLTVVGAAVVGVPTDAIITDAEIKIIIYP